MLTRLCLIFTDVYLFVCPYIHVMEFTNYFHIVMEENFQTWWALSYEDYIRIHLCVCISWSQGDRIGVCGDTPIKTIDFFLKTRLDAVLYSCYGIYQLFSRGNGRKFSNMTSLVIWRLYTYTFVCMYPMVSRGSYWCMGDTPVKTINFFY